MIRTKVTRPTIEELEVLLNSEDPGVVSILPNGEVVVNDRIAELEAALDAAQTLTLQDLATLAAKHGYAVVPAEPTEEMCCAALISRSQFISSYAKACYRVMIEAGRIK